MELNEVVRVVELWSDQYRELGAIDWINYVQIFENRGEMMGASNPHPHCQVWANQTVPNYPATEQQAQLEFSQNQGKCMLCEYLRRERISAHESCVGTIPLPLLFPSGQCGRLKCWCSPTNTLPDWIN